METRTRKREDCFHDGLKVLDTVKQSHHDISDTPRADDPITPEVVDKIIRHMLIFEEKPRPEAPHMYWKSTQIIDDAKAKIGGAQSPAFATTHGNHPRSIDAKGPRLRDPPNLPPNHQRHESSEPALIDRPYAGPKVLASKRSPFPEGSGRIFSGLPRASRLSPAYPDSHDETYEPGSSTTAHLPPLRPTSRHSGYSSSRDRGRSSSYDLDNQRPEAHTILSDINNNETGRVANDNNSSSDLSEVSHRIASEQALRGPNSHDRSFRGRPHSASNADRRDSDWRDASRDTYDPVASRSLKVTASADLAPNQTLSTANRDPAATKNRRVATQQTEMSLNEGLVLKRQGAPFPRDELFAELQARDHVSQGYILT